VHASHRGQFAADSLPQDNLSPTVVSREKKSGEAISSPLVAERNEEKNMLQKDVY
jgi:hypothetical protein